MNQRGRGENLCLFFYRFCVANDNDIASFMWTVFKEFFRFCAREKKWWLIPLVVLLLVLAAILIFASSSGIVWALYPF
jgi:hypothetical protein